MLPTDTLSSGFVQKDGTEYRLYNKIQFAS